MREYINSNLKIIKKYVNLRAKEVSYRNKLSIIQEFKEWDEESILNERNIWTLPDLTSSERFKNFYRSIKKNK